MKREGGNGHVSSDAHSSSSAPRKFQPSEFIFDALRMASEKIAPAWDLHSLVAVNPFFGVKDSPSLEALKYFEAATGGRLLPSASYFRKCYEDGEISDRDLQFAIQELQLEQQGLSLTVEDALKHIQQDDRGAGKRLHSLSDFVFGVSPSSCSDLISAEVSKWLAAYFDEGQARWKMPFRDMRLYTAWHKVARYDETLNRKGVRATQLFKRLPADPKEAVSFLSEMLAIRTELSFDNWVNYFFRLLCSVQGWAGYVQRFEFQAERDSDLPAQDDGEHSLPATVLDLLAIRLAYDLACLDLVSDLEGFQQSLETPNEFLQEADLDYLWLLAHECSYRNDLLNKLSTDKTSAKFQRKYEITCVFCIDVRSEVLRRHLEAGCKDIQTKGFAGFFGVPLSLKRVGEAHTTQQCPVLLPPTVALAESEEESDTKLKKKRARRVSLRRLHKKIQASLNSCFSYVETLWPYSLRAMFRSATGKQDHDWQNRRFSSSCSELHPLDTEVLSLEEKFSLACGAVTNMSFGDSFSPLVVLVGHASQSANNPQAASLHCGACAGQGGLPNARVLAELLNDEEVRSLLSDRAGIEIPCDTLFISGEHNTVTDEVKLDIPEGREEGRAFLILRQQLKNAQKKAQQERVNLLEPAETTATDIPYELSKRGTDWSEVRPEWGLARNASFVIGRRELSREINLEGRAFLHDYDASLDHEGKVLELILTAPMVVTNWINLQYYASTLQPRLFGAGNKTLQNVVGGLGVIEGNSGDLLNGLSEQSVRYRGEFFHQPLRLQVVVEASIAQLNEVMEKHEIVSELAGNRWLTLISIDPNLGQKNIFVSNGWLSL